MATKRRGTKRKANQAAAEVFSGSLFARFTQIEQDVKEKVAGACISGFEEIVYGTPVLTGYAASEWQVIGAKTKGMARHSVAAKERKYTGEFAGIIATARVPSLAIGLSSLATPLDFFEKQGSSTTSATGNYMKPSDAVKDGASKIMHFMKVGNNGAPVNFRFVNHAPYIGILENTSYSMQGQGFIKRGTMKMAAILRAERAATGKRRKGLSRRFTAKFRGDPKNKGLFSKFTDWLTGWVR